MQQNKKNPVSLEQFNDFLERYPEEKAEDVVAELEKQGYSIGFDLPQVMGTSTPTTAPEVAPLTATRPPDIEIPMRASWNEPQQQEAGLEGMGLGDMYSQYLTQNLPQSTMQFGQDIGTVVANPWQTAKGMGSLIVSVSAKIKNKAVGDDSGKGEEIADAIAEMYASRYGSVDDALETAYYDPVGFLGDAALFVTGIGSAVGASAKAAQLLGEVPRLGLAGRAGGKLSKVGKSVRGFGDEIDLPSRAVQALGEPVVTGAAKVGKGAFKLTPRLFQQLVLAPTRVPKWAARLGALTLAKLMGTHPVAVDATVKMFRSKTTPEIIQSRMAWRRGTERLDQMGLVELTKSTIQDLRDSRALEYVQSREFLDLANKPISVDGIEVKLSDLQDQYNFNIDDPVGKRYTRSSLFGEKEGGYFSRSLDQVKAYLDGVSGRVDDGVYTPDDLNAKELDILKQQIENMLGRMNDAEGQSSRSKRVLVDIKDSITDELNNIEGYSEMTSKYAESSELLRGLDDAFSFKVLDKANQDEALKKVINILNTDREYGRQLLSKLETQTQTPLFEELVGSEFSSGLPKTVSFNTSGIASRRGVDQGIGFALAIAAPTAQPKLWGEILRTMGGSARAVDKIVDVLTRNRHRIIKIAKEREESIRAEEQGDPMFQQTTVDPVLEQFGNQQQKDASQKIANRAVRGNYDANRIFEAISRMPKE